MKTLAQMKAKVPSRVNAQQSIFELRNKVVLALSKLADRDTCQIGVDDLEKIAQSLTPEEITPFLSCILDTDKEQKSTVRKECIRLMGVLVNFHTSLLGPHVGKMVATIVKRLRDPDSVVRNACVETMGVLASKLSNHGGEKSGVFVLLVRPLFEALGEQNKQMQSGSALCLARVIDNTHDPPVSVLQRMLTRTIKLLKNPHFMAKPAVIELNRIIIQAGGASSQNVLSAAMTSIHEALRNSDWTTRKAASIALAEIASSGQSWLGSFKCSSISSLESCRFDKVKPVRDTVLHALQYWKSLPGPDTPESSETGSSIKENYCRGEYSDITSISDSVRRDGTPNRVTNSAKRRIPLSVKKSYENYMDSRHSKADEWQIEISVPKSHNVSLADLCNEESEDSSVTKTLERISSYNISTLDNGCEYVPLDDKQDCSSVSNLVSDNFETKFVAVSHDSLEVDGLLRSTGRNRRFAAEVINNEEQTHSAKMRDCRSLDSTVTETSFQPLHGCCSQVANEMACIQKQLLEIENKHSSLMEMLQAFSTGIMDSLSMLRSKVSVLEQEVDRISHALLQGGRHSDSAISKLMKQNQSVSSPRLSTSTPRLSVDIRNKQPSLFSAKNSDIWEENTSGRSRSKNLKRATEMRTNPTVMTSRNAVMKDMQKSSGHGALNCTGKVDAVLASISGANARENGPENNNCLWQRVKGFLCKGDLDSAYAEALCSVDELVLIELLDRTGPVLESLSHKTVSDILSTLASYFLERRFTNSIIPWLQQAMELSTIHGPDYFVLSAKARREFLSAIQEAFNMEFSNPAQRRSVTQLAMRLCHLWGNSCQ
ncbi:TORTIFOLIA1-like protein 2 [Hevea brasiliensis]|uniref:TORTIFOLIA1-like protein 2 n=1 Tax=Hevea brasiliensis TaxID=3981 RepID=UPI0025D50584|nr:TORTIFOLIA1-like protein 2 [Hevea brasiliensis]XP_057994166.1 TORTIFOLIA1-like protein 2 [Hevea brasiliensis]XP_057994167.1 TORTIFOLIA1-like protein 2 [Hevea brasiliensis]